MRLSRTGAAEASRASPWLRRVGIDGFVEAILESPVGVALLATVESQARRPEGYPPVVDSSLDGVAAAVAIVEEMSFGELVELATFAAVIDVGPWISDAPSTAAGGIP